MKDILALTLVGLICLLPYLPRTDQVSAQTATLQVTITRGSSQCEDGVDNDGDGLVDYPDDLGCSVGTDNDETNPSSSSSGGGSGGSGGGGGGGGGGGIISTISGASVIFTGRAYPGSAVTVLKNGVILATASVGADGMFNIRADNISSGSHLFGVYALDRQGSRSPTVSTGVVVTPSVVTTISGIFIAPTINVDKSEVKKGNPITIFGVAVPEASLAINVNSETELNFETKADKDGLYSYTFLTTPLARGSHTAQSLANVWGEISGSSQIVGFTVGARDVAKKKTIATTPSAGDINNDGKINLADFSVLAFWYKKNNPPKAYDLNKDGKVNLVDFSIMASSWTG